MSKHVLVSVFSGVVPIYCKWRPIGSYAFTVCFWLGFSWQQKPLYCVETTMSLKVYNGMRAKGVDAGYKVGLLVRDAIVSKQEELFGKALCRLVSDRLDGREFGWYSGDIGSWFDFLREGRARMQGVYETGMRDPAFDVGFEAFFNLSGEYTLAYFHCEHPALMEVWGELSGFEDYAAWDNTDGDPSVSDEEWSARCDEWYSVLDGVALRLAFTDCPLPSYSPAFDPDPAKRAYNAARQLYRDSLGDLPDGGKGAYEIMLEINRRNAEFDAHPDRESMVASALSRLPSISAHFGR